MTDICPMSFDEARGNASRYMNPYSIRPVFVEFRNECDAEIYPEWFNGIEQREILIGQMSEYGKRYRFWLERPTDEQRLEAEWDE